MMSFAPWRAACLMRAPVTGCPSVGLAPQTRIVRASSISSSEFVAAPVPSVIFIAAAVGEWQTRAQQSMLLLPSTTRANFCATKFSSLVPRAELSTPMLSGPCCLIVSASFVEMYLMTSSQLTSSHWPLRRIIGEVMRSSA